jgi:Putative peptidoglycan binding domain
MRRLTVLVVALAIFATLPLKAQIFLNTGNPDLNNYVKQDSNAVIWDGGKNIPVPGNLPPDAPAAQSNSTAPTHVTTAAKREKTVKKQAVAKTENTDLNSINHPSPAHVDKNAGTAKVASAPKTVAAKGKTSNGQNDKANADNMALKNREEQQTAMITHKEPVPDYPADALVGHCYARCLTPDIYDLKEEVVIDKPASVKTEVIPATYITVMDTVVIVPEGKRVITIPAQYETVVENKMVAPATQKWVKTGNSKNCFSTNPKDCEIWELKQFDPVYQKVSRKVEVVPASVQEEIIPAVTKVVPHQKIVQPSREVKTEIPTTYKTVMKKVLVKKGGSYEWKEILCEKDVTESRINQIQEALIREGYDPGQVDNQMGEATKQSIIKFQKDKGLPVGNLNMETLKALGVN